MSNRHMERASISLVNRKMVISIGYLNQATTRYHCMLISMTETNKRKTVTTPNTDEDVEKLDFLYIAGGNVKQCSHSGK